MHSCRSDGTLFLRKCEMGRLGLFRFGGLVCYDDDACQNHALLRDVQRRTLDSLRLICCCQIMCVADARKLAQVFASARLVSENWALVCLMSVWRCQHTRVCVYVHVGTRILFRWQLYCPAGRPAHCVKEQSQRGLSDVGILLPGHTHVCCRRFR